jgi:toxin ParE1/3/4
LIAFEVLLTEDAARDLEGIHSYISDHDAPESAEYVLEQIEKAFLSLTQLPDRGSYPKELAVLGIKQYREVFFKPYRIMYQVQGNVVYVMLVADGRRDMQTLLQRRLLEG